MDFVCAGVHTITITCVFPGGSEKRKSSNDGEPAHGQEKRRPSTYVEGKSKKKIKSQKIQNAKSSFEGVLAHLAVRDYQNRVRRNFLRGHEFVGGPGSSGEQFYDQITF